MKITKFAHCCMLVEQKGVRIITDPGIFSTEQNELRDINFILVTHDHPDHFHAGSVKEILRNNPSAIVITNQGLAPTMEKEKIGYAIVGDGQKYDAGVQIEGYGRDHAILHSSMPAGANTGYFIDGYLFYPGDALTLPGRPVEVLAAPIAGPWLKISEAIDYAIAVKPRTAFPVHEAILRDPSFAYSLASDAVKKAGIEFKPLEAGKEYIM